MKHTMIEYKSTRHVLAGLLIAAGWHAIRTGRPTCLGFTEDANAVYYALLGDDLDRVEHTSQWFDLDPAEEDPYGPWPPSTPLEEYVF